MYDQVFITGFKKFGNVEVNPTELVIDQLTKFSIPNVYPNKLDVTVDEVDVYIFQMQKHQQTLQKNKRILNIHCGVGPNKVYFLEHCAYNNKDFGIPDNNGNQYLNQKICSKHQLDEPLLTKLNLQQMINKMKDRHEVTISQDPGRYLCNYVYYCSLNQLKCERQNVDCLFIHFPGLKVKSHEQNISFIRDILKILLKQHKNLQHQVQ